MVLLKTKSDTKQGQQPSLPTGHFILLPSHGNTMLLKSIATNELMLPVDLNQTVEGPNTEATEIIGASLDQVSKSQPWSGGVLQYTLGIISSHSVALRGRSLGSLHAPCICEWSLFDVLSSPL